MVDLEYRKVLEEAARQLEAVAGLEMKQLGSYVTALDFEFTAHVTIDSILNHLSSIKGAINIEFMTPISKTKILHKGRIRNILSVKYVVNYGAKSETYVSVSNNQLVVFSNSLDTAIKTQRSYMSDNDPETRRKEKSKSKRGNKSPQQDD